MAAILRRPDRGRAMGDRGRERVRLLFTRDRLVEGTLDAYRKALEGGAEKPEEIREKIRKLESGPVGR